MGKWTFITNHALVLGQITQDTQSTARQIAAAVGITERTAHKIIFDLDAAGYITRTKVGRRNVYEVNSGLLMRHPTRRSVPLGDLLQILTPARSRR